MIKVVVPDDSPAVLARSGAFAELKQRAGVDYHDTLPGSEEELARRCAGAEVVLNIRSSSRFNDAVLARLPGCRLLSLWGTGTDNVDLAAAARRGITVTNTPGVSAPAVAEHTLALLLAAARRLPQVDAATRRAEWPRGDVVLLAGKTLGVIGLGAIGRCFARLGAGIGMRVLAWTMHPKPDAGFELVALDELLQRSDAVSLHLRLSPETRGFIGRRELDRMKRSAILVNTARGALVDQAALVAALAERRIAAAGLDVFETEPLPAGDPLMRLDNVVLTPHSAGVATEALEAGLQLAVANIWSFVEGRPANVVAAPPRDSASA
jgi:phosphoglycerate dehydrogenase-like enzyme